MPAFPVEAIDTVGAGDAFSGALAASLAAGAPIEDALLVASATGGLTCTRRGAVDAMPTREEVVGLHEAARSRAEDGLGARVEPMTAPRPARVHYAWVILPGLSLALLAASGVRSAFGVFIKPMEAEFGWDRTALSLVAALSFVFNGASGPVVGRLADRWGSRMVLASSGVLLGSGRWARRSSCRSGSSTRPSV